MNSRWILPVLVGLVLAACQARGPADNRADFRYQWLDYLQGQDIQATCRADGPDRVRLIYNADFNTQIRTFDLFTVFIPVYVFLATTTAPGFSIPVAGSPPAAC